MRNILILFISLLTFVTAQSQNGVYISSSKGFYRYPDNPNIEAESINHKFIISIDISDFSGKGKIDVRDTYDNSVVTYEITGKVKEFNDETNNVRSDVYWGNITIYGLSQPGMILLMHDPKTGNLEFVTYKSLKFNTETHYVGLKPIEETLPSSGSGFLISQSGLLITNYHVVAKAKSISIIGINNDFQNEYSAVLVAYDEKSDIALLKAKGVSSCPAIPYSVLLGQKEVGDDVFVLGYPLLSSMGNEIKLTDGLISSLSGFSGISTYYQISSPIQPGNSGGPLFDSDGNIIGIVSAKLTSAENVGYAIKSKVLLDFLSSKGVHLNNSIQIKSINPLSAKVKSLKKYVVIVKSQR